MNNLERLQQHLRSVNVTGLLVPSTDEYLSEYAAPCGQRLRWLTGFSGSTGLAIVLQDRAALFLDGRYKTQGKRETSGLGIEVLDASAEGRETWLTAHVHAG